MDDAGRTLIRAARRGFGPRGLTLPALLVAWLLALLLATMLTLLLAIVLAVDSAPSVARRDDVSPADIGRAVSVARLHDPRRATIGQLRRVPLTERDIDLLVYHAARRWLAADTRVRLQAGRVLLQASVAAPLGTWLNIELTLRQTAQLPEVERLRIGQLPVPARLAMPALQAFAARRGVQADALLAVEWIERVTLAADRVTVSYRIGPDTLNRLRAALVAPVDQQRLRAYNDRLASLTSEVSGREVSLAQLLPPLMALAAERSQPGGAADSASAGASGSSSASSSASAGGGDAATENRAALLALAFYANHRPLGLVVPAAYGWPRPKPLRVTLQQRHDLPLHFLISALIAAESGTPLADAVGLWKELADARQGGSGFSFNDLAADLAGTRFGEMAVGQPALLQQRLKARQAVGVNESDWMPDTRDLPESLTEAEFLARYGGVGGNGYRRLLAEIESRVARLPLFR